MNSIPGAVRNYTPWNEACDVSLDQDGIRLRIQFDCLLDKPWTAEQRRAGLQIRATADISCEIRPSDI